MKNIFLETSSLLTKNEILEVASKSKIELPNDFIEHYSQYNGGYSSRRCYQWSDGKTTKLDHFFAIQYKGFTQFEEVYNDTLIIENVLPLGYVPFAIDDGGNLFCLCILYNNYNTVFYAAMYHYNEALPSEYLINLSTSFIGFIEKLICC